jgi:NTE family protein
MKDAHDARYISKRHAKNIIFIPTDGAFSIEFQLTSEQKKALYELGRQHAKQFFSSWCY